MTPVDLVTACRDLYNATSDTFFADTQIYNWIWQGEHQLAKRARCIESHSTASTTNGVQNYSYPTNAFLIKRVAVNGKKLKRITQREDDAITLSNQTVTTSGWPIYYYDWNGSIYLRPIPDSTYQIDWYTYNDASLPSATGTLDVPTIYHMDLVDFVLMRMFEKDKDIGNVQVHKMNWEESLKEAISDTTRRKKADSFRTVQSEDNLPVTILGEA